MNVNAIWRPIIDLHQADLDHASDELSALARVWELERTKLQSAGALTEFTARLNREWAVETGILERLYSLDRGVTYNLIEKGLDAAFIAHGDSDQPAEYVIGLIKDQESTVEGLFDFVGRQRQLSESYVKELHAQLTRRQPTTEVVDQFGNVFETDLRRGAYKVQPNNPLRPDGELVLYCPPEQVDSEMAALVRLHIEHVDQGVAPEVEAAWLHHRFTQIHPFQDGNGRVARALASLVLLRAGWFPLVVTRDERDEYIGALEYADSGDLAPLIDLVVRLERSALVAALGLASNVRHERSRVEQVLSQIVDQYASPAKAAAPPVSLQAMATGLLQQADNRFAEIKAVLDHGLATSEEPPRIFVDRADDDDAPRRDWHRFQIIATARKIDYFANFATYSAWTRIVVELASGRSEILLSIHGIGPEHRGLMGATLTFVRRADDELGAHPVVDMAAASEELFQFNRFDDPAKLAERFEAWLEVALVNALEMWRRAG